MEPPSRSSPSVGARAPTIVSKSVDLPAPFGPMNPMRSPRMIVTVEVADEQAGHRSRYGRPAHRAPDRHPAREARIRTAIASSPQGGALRRGSRASRLRRPLACRCSGRRCCARCSPARLATCAALLVERALLREAAFATLHDERLRSRRCTAWPCRPPHAARGRRRLPETRGRG